MAISITVVRPIMVNGSRVAAAAQVSVDDALAHQLVSNGDATYTNAQSTAQAPGNFFVYAAGNYTWAGGAAATASISVPGIKATDIVSVTLVARASTETLVQAVKDTANGEIDLTLSANGTNTTTKLDYIVLRPL